MDPISLRQHIYSLGASLVGFARLLPPQVDGSASGGGLPGSNGFPYAISIACSLPGEVIDSIREGPTWAYYEQYQETNALLNNITTAVEQYIHTAGYKAQALRATVEDNQPREDYIASFNNKLPHKTVATLSGLGWIGKSSLLISFEYGPRVRLGTVLTDMPLEAGKAVVRGRCGSCRACLKACPVGAIKGKEWQVGHAKADAPLAHITREELFDAYACREKALELTAKLGVRDSLCGICIRACPVGKELLA